MAFASSHGRIGLAWSRVAAHSVVVDKRGGAKVRCGFVQSMGPYISNARQLTRSPSVEDACTSPVSRIPLLLRKPLHVPVCENACASSPTITLHILPIENRRILLPGTSGASCVRDVRCILFRRVTPYRRPIRLALPNQRAARLLPTRAASENVNACRVHVKQFVMRAKKNFEYSDRCAGHVP